MAARDRYGRPEVAYAPAPTPQLKSVPMAVVRPGLVLFEIGGATESVAKEAFRLASAKQGRFRSFFMKTFCNFVASQLRRQQARKRAPDHRAAERVEDHPELVAPDSAQKDAFDALWARQVLSAALERMRRECEAQGRTTLWRLFETRILAPLLDGETPIPYGILVRRFGLRSPSEASNLLITARRMFVRNLKAVVGETVADDRCVDAEILALKRALSK